jgi:hypothetical protein
MLEARKQLGKELQKQNLTPLYYFMDPLVKISFSTRAIINELFKEFPFTFFPVNKVAGHEKCIRPALQLNNPEIMTGVNKTRIFIQSGNAKPPQRFLEKENKTPISIARIANAMILMFKIGAILQLHLHLPTHDMLGNPLTELARNDIITQFFSEIRILRIPTDIEIATDGINSVTGLPLSHNYIEEQFKNITQNLPTFLEPTPRVNWPAKLSTNLPDLIDPTIFKCRCALCTISNNSDCSFFNNNLSVREHQIFKGQINDILENNNFSDTRSTISSSQNSRIYPQLRAAINSLGDVQEQEFDIDEPLDVMNLCDEDEMQKFLNKHPGCEEDDFILDPNLPTQKSDPNLFEGYDMNGIPDQFTPGDWRKTDMIDRLVDVEPEIIEKFKLLLDKHRNVLSYYPTDCRPVLLHGKPATIDIQLTTDKPIFSKPYPLVGPGVDICDNKLDTLLFNNEIHEIDSKYNVAIILTHHNSSQKHVEGFDKLCRLVLDLRIVNALMLHKNLHSYLVKKVDTITNETQGSNRFTASDIQKAFRAVVASPRTQQICAFRVPSSKKYPHKTFAFRSACDGLANMPGFYSYIVQEALSEKSRKCTIAHIDDLLIFSKNDLEHLDHIDSVLTDLGKANFMVSAKKFKPFQREILFLGHMLDGKNKWIPEERKNYFDTIEPPQTKKQLQQLLGTANYMSPFIDSFAMLVAPLYDAMKGKTDKQPLTLNEVQLKSFYELRHQIKTAPKTGLLDTSKPIYMECDASLVGVGSILYQEEILPDGSVKKIVLRYGSRRFSLTESLNHNSLEREAMAILISAKQHMEYLRACPEAIIKTDLKSLITILSCFNNPESGRMAQASSRIYTFPFKWKLIHIPGVDLPVADYLSRIHKPYTSLYTDRHLRYPDLKRDNIMMPPEWRKNPDLILTTSDLIKAMRDQIVFIEKSSNSVKEKRLKALINEVTILYNELPPDKDDLATILEADILNIRHKLETEPKTKHRKPLPVSALTATPQRTLITPEFLIKHQNANPKLHNIIIMLRTLTKDKIPKNILKRYRLLNDSILVTRKYKNKPYDHPGNLRIVCDAKMTIHILSTVHVMSCHYGMNTLNHIFINTYKCIEGSTQGFVKLVCNACRACRFHRVTNKKVIPEGRIPIPNVPNDTWQVDFMVFKQDQYFRGRKIVAAFNILDLFSNLLISIPVKDQRSETVINCLKNIFSYFNVPRKIVSDNAQALCKNPQVLKFLKNNNVKTITTITAHNSQGNKVERLHKLFRETLQLVQETFKREKQFDMYYTVVQMINSRPLTLALHPNIKKICEELKTEPGVITPFSLHFGLPPSKHPTIPLESTLEPLDRGTFRAKWQYIITEHNKRLQQELDERNKSFSGKEIEVGTLVLIKNMIAHKEQLKFYKEIYEVIKISKARYTCAPLFNKGQIMEVNGNNLKPYTYSELFNQLPDNIRYLMGENLSPEQLKKQSISDPDNIPLDLQNWKHWRPPTVVNLRNRLTPEDRISEPALSLIETDILSSDSSSNILTLPDTIPDHHSELESVLSNKGVPQIKTTKTGIIQLNYDNDHKQRVPILQKPRPRSTIEDNTLTLDDIEKSWQRKLQKQTKNDILRQLHIDREIARHKLISKHLPPTNLPDLPTSIKPSIAPKSPQQAPLIIPIAPPNITIETPLARKPSTVQEVTQEAPQIPSPSTIVPETISMPDNSIIQSHHNISNNSMANNSLDITTNNTLDNSTFITLDKTGSTSSPSTTFKDTTILTSPDAPSTYFDKYHQDLLNFLPDVNWDDSFNIINSQKGNEQPSSQPTNPSKTPPPTKDDSTTPKRPKTPIQRLTEKAKQLLKSTSSKKRERTPSPDKTRTPDSPLSSTPRKHRPTPELNIADRLRTRQNLRKPLRFQNPDFTT